MSEEHQFPEIKRRRFLAMTGAAGGATILAGCGGGDDTETSTTVPDESGDGGESTTTEGTDGDSDSESDDSSDSDNEPLGGDFIDASSEAANTLDPRMNELAWVSSMAMYIYDGLLIQHPDGSEMVPHLASEMPTQEDETTLTVPLREGVTFHNGDELTAEDVAYTYNWILDPDNGSIRRQNVAFMDSVEVVDDYTVRFNLENPYALFNNTIAEPIVPKSVADDLGPDEFGRNPVGTGPFQLAEWEQSDHITLERFDDYFLKTPNLDSYTVRVIPEAQVQFVELATGNIHSAAVSNQLMNKAKSENDIILKKLDQFDYNGLIFNALREPFDDVRVREAMQYAVDYDQMLEATKGELGERVYGFMPKSVNQAWDFPWQDWDDEYLPDKDHDEAQRLLKEAGYGDGFGRTLKIKSLSFEKFKAMSIVLQNELEKLGIDAEIEEMTIGQWVESLNTDTYDVNVYGWSGGQDPDGYYYYLFRNLRNDEGGMSEEDVGNSSAGMLYSANPGDDELASFDEVVREARTILDQEERKSLYIEAAEMIQGKYPHIPVYSEQTANTYSASVKDFDPTSFSDQDLCNEWHNSYIEE
jgi:peptide/nickel transport system substrate-binding protein